MPKPQIQILVCTKERPSDHPKPCCAGRSSLAIYRRFKDLVREHDVRDRVLVTRTGCLHHCSRGSTVAVWPANLWYGRVGLTDVEEILEHALDGGREEIARLRMPDGDWE